MTKKIADQWLADIVATVNARDYTAHMDLISNRVSLHGMPGFETIDYDDWSRQCQHEFENKIIKSIHYSGFKLVAETATSMMFKTFETVTATDGTVNAQGVEILLEQEADGKWRMVQERILPDDETAHDQLLTM